MIVGLIKGPNTYAPTKHPMLAQQRRDIVLRLLREQGRLTEEEWKAAVNQPVHVAPPDDVLADAPYFRRHSPAAGRGGDWNAFAGRPAYRQHARSAGAAVGHRRVGKRAGQA